MVELAFLEEDEIIGGLNGYQVLDQIREISKEFPALSLM